LPVRVLAHDQASPELEVIGPAYAHPSGVPQEIGGLSPSSPASPRRRVDLAVNGLRVDHLVAAMTSWPFGRFFHLKRLRSLNHLPGGDPFLRLGSLGRTPGLVGVLLGLDRDPGELADPGLRLLERRLRLREPGPGPHESAELFV